MSERIKFGPDFPLPIFPVSSGTMEVNPTGSWRYLRPIVEHRISPCRAGCPAVAYGASGSIGLNPYCLRLVRKR